MILRLRALLHTLVLFSAILATNIFAQIQESEPVPAIPVQIGFSFLQIGDNNFFVANFENFQEWHTYWLNPGDAGLATKVTFAQNGSNLEIPEFGRPAPEKFVQEGDLWAYGHDGAYSIFYKIPSTLLEKFKTPVSVKVNWLACRHICIPGHFEGDVQLKDSELVVLKATPDQLGKLNPEKNLLEKRLNELPKESTWPNGLDLALYQGPKEQQLTLYLNYPKVFDLNPNYSGHPLLIPFPNPLFNFGHEQLYRGKGPDLFGKSVLDWDGQYQTPPVVLPKDGKFTKPISIKFIFYPPTGESGIIIEKQFDHFQQGQLKEMESLYTLLQPMARAKLPTPSFKAESSDVTINNGNEGTSLFIILLMAILGGFILNFMPCVLPVISLKLFGLLKHREESKAKLLQHNLSYLLGILVSFLLLGLVTVFLKVTGQTVGWGLQLQSQRFVAFMAGVIFILALNLFGLFEFKVPGGKYIGNVQVKEGFLADFLGGVLATILSTPCSAPFLGTAIAFAFTRGPLEILVIFEAVGIGLGIPFMLTAIFPASMKILPRPGEWMEHLKKFLGLTLLLTTIWLLDIYQALTDGSLPTTKLLTTLVLAFFAFYFQKHITNKFLWRALIFVLPLMAFTHLLLWPNSTVENSPDTTTSGLLLEKQSQGLNWISWSESEMQKAKEAKETVFIDFSAQWCFTCKANEKLVIETTEFKQMAEEKNLKLMLADWTKRDEIIGRWLLKHGAAGVPAYYIQKPDGSLKFLGETLTIEKIKKELP